MTANRQRTVGWALLALGEELERKLVQPEVKGRAAWVPWMPLIFAVAFGVPLIIVGSMVARTGNRTRAVPPDRPA